MRETAPFVLLSEGAEVGGKKKRRQEILFRVLIERAREALYSPKEPDKGDFQGAHKMQEASSATPTNST